MPALRAGEARENQPRDTPHAGTLAHLDAEREVEVQVEVEEETRLQEMAMVEEGGETPGRRSKLEGLRKTEQTRTAMGVGANARMSATDRSDTYRGETPRWNSCGRRPSFRASNGTKEQRTEHVPTVGADRRAPELLLVQEQDRSDRVTQPGSGGSGCGMCRRRRGRSGCGSRLRRRRRHGGWRLEQEERRREWG